MALRRVTLTFPRCLVQISFAIHWIQILTHLLYKSGNSNPGAVAFQFWWVICLCCIGGREDFTSATWTETWVRLSKTHLTLTRHHVHSNIHRIVTKINNPERLFHLRTRNIFLIYSAFNLSGGILKFLICNVSFLKLKIDLLALPHCFAMWFMHACTNASSKTYFFKVHRPVRTPIITTFMKIWQKSLESDRARGTFTALLLS